MPMEKKIMVMMMVVAVAKKKCPLEFDEFGDESDDSDQTMTMRVMIAE